MLPARWPRKRAHDLFGERHAQWHGAAQEHFRALEATGPGPAGEASRAA